MDIYLEIVGNRFFIAALKGRSGRFVCTDFEEVYFDNLEIEAGLIYNSSAVYKKTKSFLEDHKLIGASALVCYPELKRFSSIKRDFAVFQISLALCKAGLKIGKIVDEEMLR